MQDRLAAAEETETTPQPCDTWGLSLSTLHDHAWRAGRVAKCVYVSRAPLSKCLVSPITAPRHRFTGPNAPFGSVEAAMEMRNDARAQLGWREILNSRAAVRTGVHFSFRFSTKNSTQKNKNLGAPTNLFISERSAWSRWVTSRQTWPACSACCLRFKDGERPASLGSLRMRQIGMQKPRAGKGAR